MPPKIPLMSIIIINYNYARFIIDCLKSVRHQTFCKIECIIVDNSSTDDSLSVISEFMSEMQEVDTQIEYRLISMESNVQQTKACVAGFQMSKGEFVCFLDADDALDPTFCEAHIFAHLSTRHAVGVTCTDMYQGTANGVVATTTASFSRYVLSGQGRLRPFTRAISDADYRDLLGTDGPRAIDERDLHLVEKETSSDWVWSPTSSLCFRRDAVSLMFRHPPNIVASVDAYLLRGTSSLMGGILIDKPLVYYRYHGSNIFAKRPPLANFRSFQYEQLKQEDRQVIEAVISCYLANIEFLSAGLEHHSYFIKAVNIVSRGGLDPLADDPLYMTKFIDSNKFVLEETFGRAAVAEWRTWYRRLPIWQKTSSSALRTISKRLGLSN